MSTNNSSSVIKNRGFLNLWTNQVLVQLAYNSLNFALIIWVFRLTDSNTAVAALLFAVYLPAVLFGLFSGVLVDITDKKKIIMVINVLMALLFIALIFTKGSYVAVLVITFLVNTLAQFYIPAESSAIPIIVKKNQLMNANSLFSVTLFSSFLVGFALAGPLINHLGINTVFGFGAISLSIAAILSFYFPSIINKSSKQSKDLLKALKKRDFPNIRGVAILEIRQTMKLIRTKLAVFSSILILAGVQAVIGILAVIVPSFLERVLQINATDASYIVVIPLGLGMVLGGLIISKVGYKLPKRILVGSAITIAGLLLFSVGVAPLISPVVKYFPRQHPLPFFYQPPLAAILVVGSFLVGMMMVSIMVPSQTVVQENTPEQDRGKVFAVLGTVMAAFSLLPVLFAGVMSDLFGTMPIFIALGGSIVLVGLFTLKPDFFFSEHQLPFYIREFLGLGHWAKRK